MKNIDIKDGGPSLASDRKTEKLAETWKPKTLKDATQAKKEFLVKTKWFRLAATELEKKAFIMGFDAAVGAVNEAIVENYHISDRIKEWRKRQG